MIREPLTPAPLGARLAGEELHPLGTAASIGAVARPGVRIERAGAPVVHHELSTYATVRRTLADAVPQTVGR